MKLAQIGDFVAVPWVYGRCRNVSSWRYLDTMTENKVRVRSVYHYGTLMGSFILAKDEVRWVFQPESAGWGSVSDQQGMNKMLANYGWRYRRNHGVARYERI